MAYFAGCQLLKKTLALSDSFSHPYFGFVKVVEKKTFKNPKTVDFECKIGKRNKLGQQRFWYLLRMHSHH